MGDILNLGTSPKKARKPQEHTRQLWDAILDVAEDYERMSIRQLYYQLVSRGAIPKTEAAYKRVCDASAQLRISGELPYRKIADGHRVRRIVFAHDGISDALESAHHLYRRDMWRSQPVNVEVWSEKDALTGVIQPVCDRYGVTYVATRGFPSITLRYETAEVLKELGKPTTIYYFGDHDASGQQISTNLEAELREHGADVTVERVALTIEQVLDWALPTRPGKRTDSRHAAFVETYGSDASVELDALPPNILERLVTNAIVKGIQDIDEWQRMKDIERLERKTLASLLEVPFEAGMEYFVADEAA